MRHENKFNILPILSLLSFILMVTVNALANILPINGITSGDVSDAYPNLFAPAGLTFSIWGLIYLLLAGYVLYSTRIIKDTSRLSSEDANRIDGFFILSSLANSAWIFAWHYRQLLASLFLIVVLLLSIIAIHLRLRSLSLTGRQKFFLRLPFSVYFGWLTVATIANVTTLLASINFEVLGISQPAWMVAVLIVSLAITSMVVLKSKDAAYGAVIVWAYAGILNKHLSEDPGFGGAYPAVIATVIICMVVILTLMGLTFWKRSVRSPSS